MPSLPNECRQRFALHNSDRVTQSRRKLKREELAALIRKNAEDLLMELCGKKFERAYNPDCPPKKSGRVRSK